MSKERELQDAIVEFLGKSEEFNEHRVVFVVEDQEDPVKAVRKAIANTVGLAVVVSCVGFKRRANSGAKITGTLALQLDIFENIPLNRAAKSRMTGQTANEIIREKLHWKEFEGLGRLRFISSRRNDGSELASWESDWEIEIGAEEIRWGEAFGLFGIIQSRRVRFAGSVVEEPDRFGDVGPFGVRDKHIEVELTALMPDTYSPMQIGDSFEMNVAGEKRVFTCNASEFSEESEEATTMRIAGRTYKTK